MTDEELVEAAEAAELAQKPTEEAFWEALLRRDES